MFGPLRKTGHKPSQAIDGWDNMGKGGRERDGERGKRSVERGMECEVMGWTEVEQQRHWQKERV